MCVVHCCVFCACENSPAGVVDVEVVEDGIVVVVVVGAANGKYSCCASYEIDLCEIDGLWASMATYE